MINGPFWIPCLLNGPRSNAISVADAMLPQELLVWQTVRYYCDQWTADGTLITINAALR